MQNSCIYEYCKYKKLYYENILAFISTLSIIHPVTLDGDMNKVVK
jgi:hypothetical protein